VIAMPTKISRQQFDRLEDVLLIGAENMMKEGRFTAEKPGPKDFRRTIGRCMEKMARTTTDPARLERIERIQRWIAVLDAAAEKRRKRSGGAAL
jgi:hypothetical protein